MAKKKQSKTKQGMFKLCIAFIVLDKFNIKCTANTEQKINRIACCIHLSIYKANYYICKISDSGISIEKKNNLNPKPEI